MIVLLNLVAYEVNSLDKRYSLKFCSRSTCSTSKDMRQEYMLCTFFRYFISNGSLAWYYPMTWLKISWESLLVFSMEAPISKVWTMPAMRASYSTWLLLAVNLNFSVCSMTILQAPLGPSQRRFLLRWRRHLQISPILKVCHRLQASWILPRNLLELVIWYFPLGRIGCRILIAPLPRTSSFQPNQVYSKLDGHDN